MPLLSFCHHSRTIAGASGTLFYRVKT